MPENSETLDPRILKSLETICRIDSRTALSPDGATEVAGILGRELEPLGFTCERVPCDTAQGPRGQHLIATRNPGATPKVVFLGHCDTVLGPDEVPYRYEESEGRIYGAGVADMKGGLVLMVEAIRLALAEGGAVSQAELKVVVNVTEEASTEQVAPFLRECCKGACATLNFEPCIGNAEGAHILPTGRKGIFRAHVACTGLSAHAGNAHRSGVSAIRELARKVDMIEAVTDYEKNVTANVGVISGGYVYNQVPDTAELDFEIRCVEPQTMQAVADDLLPRLTESTLRSADGKAATSLSVERLPAFRPYPPNPGTEELLKRYVAIAKAQGIHAETEPRGGASDTNSVYDLAASVDGLGIIGCLFHNPGEWADVSTFAPRTRAAAALLNDVCENPPAPMPAQ